MAFDEAPANKDKNIGTGKEQEKVPFIKKYELAKSNIARIAEGMKNLRETVSSEMRKESPRLLDRHVILSNRIYQGMLITLDARLDMDDENFTIARHSKLSEGMDQISYGLSKLHSLKKYATDFQDVRGSVVNGLGSEIADKLTSLALLVEETEKLTK